VLAAGHRPRTIKPAQVTPGTGCEPGPALGAHSRSDDALAQLCPVSGPSSASERLDHGDAAVGGPGARRPDWPAAWRRPSTAAAWSAPAAMGSPRLRTRCSVPRLSHCDQQRPILGQRTVERLPADRPVVRARTASREPARILSLDGQQPFGRPPPDHGPAGPASNCAREASSVQAGAERTSASLSSMRCSPSLTRFCP
jgi:hypothetical protein